MRSLRSRCCILLLGFFVAGAVIACGESGFRDPLPPVNHHQDTTVVTGQIDGLFDTLPTLRLTGAAPRPETAARQPQGDSAIAGLPREDGRTSRLAVGAVTDGSYTIPQVPPARRTVVVTIIDSENSTKGRVLVQDETRPDEILVNEPVNGETSLETAIYMGTILGYPEVPEGRINPPQMALVHRFSEDIATPAASTRSEIQALVDAFDPAQEVFVRGFIEMTGGYDSLTVNQGVRDHSQAYAEARDGGTDAETAHDAFVDGAVSAYVDLAGRPQQVATAWGAFATLHDDVLAGATTLTRLESAQNLLHISVTARQQVVAGVADGTAGKSAVSDALDDILAAGMGASDMSGFMSAVAAAVRDGADALKTARGDALASELSAADLGAFIDPSQGPADIAASLPDYISGVESAAGDADLASLLIALMGGPGYGG